MSVNRPVRITLHEDGTITGARQGTWKATAGTNLLTMSIDGVTYQGAFDRPELSLGIAGEVVRQGAPMHKIVAMGEHAVCAEDGI